MPLQSPYYRTLKWVRTVQEVENALEIINRQHEIAVDCEWDDISKLDVLTIGICNRNAYLFDITNFGVEMFDDTGLREMLESDRPRKLMFDCRNDAIILSKPPCNVSLAGVLDLQVADCAKRGKDWRDSRSWRSLEDSLKAMQPKQWPYCGDLGESIALKQIVSLRIRDAKRSGRNIWSERPFTIPDLEEYCAVDTVNLFKLREHLGIRQDFRKRMLEESQNRIDSR